MVFGDIRKIQFFFLCAHGVCKMTQPGDTGVHTSKFQTFSKKQTKIDYIIGHFRENWPVLWLYNEGFVSKNALYKRGFLGNPGV